MRLEAVGLGRARIPGVGRDLDPSVPVAEAEVVEPRPRGPVGRDHRAALAAHLIDRPEIADRAVGKADADGVGGLCRIHPFGQVAAGIARRAGSGQECDALPQCDWFGRQRKHHIRWRIAAQH